MSPTDAPKPKGIGTPAVEQSQWGQGFTAPMREDGHLLGHPLLYLRPGPGLSAFINCFGNSTRLQYLILLFELVRVPS